MPKRWVILTCMLFLGSAGASEATPLDSPDIVYIDGTPCNGACQSYMAWSRKIMPIPGQPKAVAHRGTGIRGERSNPAAQARIAKQAVPNSNKMPREKAADLPLAGNAAAAPDATRTNIAGSPPKGNSAAGSNVRTIQEQVVAATALAERATAATAPEQKSNNTDGVSPNDTDHLVALLMARAEIKSVSDLASKNVAIDDRQTASNNSVRAAMVAAGAAEVQMSDSQTKAVDRLVSGEVQAAVLTLVSPEAAEWFPDIAGFKIFRIPLSPRSLQARLDPEGNATAKSDTPPAKIVNSPPEAAAANPSSRTIRQQVAAATALAEQVTASTPVPAREQKADITVGSGHSETVLRGDAEKTAPVSPSTPDLLVALVMARAEIKSVSDLASKNVAIDDRQTASNNSVRTAMVAAGAAEVQLSDSQTKAVDRLVSGEVQAAVLTLVSPEAAEWFPDIAGFKIFRIPLARDLEYAQRVIGARMTPDRPANSQIGQTKPVAEPAAAEQPAASAVQGNQEASRLMARASALLARGDIGAARIVLERVVEMGSAEASFALAETYDPHILSSWGTYGTRGDASKARELYAKATVGGIQKAKDRFNALRQ